MGRILNPQEREQLILKNWMSHDGYWFGQIAQEWGIKAANRLNRALARRIGRTDIFRLTRALGISKIASREQYFELFQKAMELYCPPHFQYDVRLAGNIQEFYITKCFAYDAVSKAGLGESYLCGVFERIGGWLDALGVGYEMDPAPGRCLMTHGQPCRRIIRLAL